MPPIFPGYIVSKDLRVKFGDIWHSWLWRWSPQNFRKEGADVKEKELQIFRLAFRVRHYHSLSSFSMLSTWPSRFSKLIKLLPVAGKDLLLIPSILWVKSCASNSLECIGWKPNTLKHLRSPLAPKEVIWAPQPRCAWARLGFGLQYIYYVHGGSGSSRYRHGFLNVAGAAAPVTVQFWPLTWSHVGVKFGRRSVPSRLPLTSKSVSHSTSYNNPPPAYV